ncbi:MAG: hypothetical protein K1Y36_22465 [Blastocatellia bacterium]|nr:hypothetical protein [Blastocatellia bacterium]
MYKPCRQCQFWVPVQTETTCANCGILEPYLSYEAAFGVDESSGWRGWVIGFMALVGAGTGGYLGWQDGLLSAFFFGCAASGAAALGTTLVFAYFRSVREGRYANPGATCLKQDEALILKKLGELDPQSPASTNKSRRRKGKPEPSGPEPVPSAMAAEQVHLRHQYQVKLWAIELVRWSNLLEPLRDEWNMADPPECRRRIETVQTARKAGAALVAKWEQETELLTQGEGHIVLDHLQRALAAAAQLQQALVARHALLVTQADTSLKLGKTPLPEDILPDAVDLFNARVAVNEFSLTLKELETELARRQSQENRLG